MRRGPVKEKGLARSENIGSVRKVTPSIRTRNVEWPIQVRLGVRAIAVLSYGTRGAAPGRGDSVTQIRRPKNPSFPKKPRPSCWASTRPTPTEVGISTTHLVDDLKYPATL